MGAINSIIKKKNYSSYKPLLQKAYFYNFGCRLNQYESNALENHTQDYHIQTTQSIEEADYVIINTCTVTNRSDQKSRSLIRKIHHGNPKAKIVVTGCYATTDAHDLEKLKGVYCVVPNQQKSNLLSILKEKRSTAYPLTDYSNQYSGIFNYPYSQKGEKARAYLKIQDGCNKACSYCKIPQARGKAVSKNFEHILDEAMHLIDLGYHELILTGVNIGSYHNSNKTFYQLLNALLNLNGNFYLRISSIEPGDVTKELAELMTHPKMGKFLHVPLQSGSDKILKLMNRGYLKKHYIKNIEAIRVKVPDIHIGTDIILGFPLETDQDFKETLAFSQEMEFANIHLFPFSRRKNTSVESLLKDPLSVNPKSIIKQRVSKLNEVKLTLQNKYYQKTIGNTYRGIIEKSKNLHDPYSVLTENYTRLPILNSTLQHGGMVYGVYNKDYIFKLKNANPK